VYIVSGFIRFNAGESGGIGIHLNGVEVSGNTNTSHFAGNASFTGYMLAGDIVELKVASTTAYTIEAGARFGIVRVSGVRGPQGMEGPMGSTADEKIAYQENDLVITSNATYQDTDLVLSLQPGTYIVEAETWLRSHATPGALLQLMFSGTVGWATCKRVGGQDGTTIGQAVTLSLPNATTNQNYTDEGAHIFRATINVTVAGNLKLQFRQNASNANAVTFRRGSYLRVRDAVQSQMNIDTEVLADSPLGYWKCDEASGNLADSSGNGNDLPIVGSPITVYQFEGMDPNNPSRKGMLVNTGGQTNYAGGGTLGLTTPTTFSFECWGIFYQPGHFMGYGGDGETAATNVALQFEALSGGTLDFLWEYGSGTNGPSPASYRGGVLNSVPVHVAVVKDATERTCKAYINGRLANTISYTVGQEHTGGTSGIFTLFGSKATSVPGCDGLYCGAAFYTSVLSQERIQAHARALGLF
jgi:hypothetical protein